MNKMYRFQILVIPIIMILSIFGCSPHNENYTGQVLDCQTNDPIAKAEVSVSLRGWGFSDGGLVWDKEYVNSTQSDDSGRFKISLGSNSALIKVTKEGYITAEQREEPGKEIIVRALKGNDSIEVTYNCKLSSECLSCSVEGNAKVCKNICA